MSYLQSITTLRPSRTHVSTFKPLAWVIGVLFFALAAMATAATSSPPLTAATFAEPAATRPKIRFWLPLIAIDEKVLRAEVADIAAAGFSGIEVIGVPVASGGNPTDVGFGTAAWNSAMAVLRAETARRGLAFDQTVTASYPPAVPLPPQSPAASQELVYGVTEVQGAFDDTLPPPVEGTPGLLVGVSAARVADGAEVTAKRLVLDRDSLVDLTARVRGGRLAWSAPRTGRWVIIASWARPTGAKVTGITTPEAVVVDHFGMAGTRALEDFWQKNLATSDARHAYRRQGGDIFEDSLHLNGFTLWTADFLAEFKRRRGYDLRPLLPAVYIPHLNEFFYAMRGGAELTTESAADFEFSDGTGRRIREDYYQTLTDLYNERHLAALHAFFNGLGLHYRVQPSYGQSLEMTQSATLVDVPETESFQLDDLIDGYRVEAGAAHLANKPVYSAECCAVPGMALGFSWRDTLGHVSKLFAGGVNQIVLHGYPHATGPGAVWPGWSAFGQVFSELYPRLPSWRHASDVTAYIGRQQLLLRQGQQKLDVAVYRLSYWDDGHYKFAKIDNYWRDPALTQAGYSYDFVSPALLALPSAKVSGGVLAPSGPGYRALILDAPEAMPEDALRRVLGFARAGLPVLIVGELPTRALGFHPRRDATVAMLAIRLAALPGVRRVNAAAGVPAALTDMGVRPAVEPATASDLLTVRRVAGEQAYYLFNNPSTEPIDVMVDVAAGAATELDLWTGKMVAAPKQIAVDADRMSLRIRLAEGQSRAFMVGPEAAPAVAAAVPPSSTPISLSHWSLQLEAWSPGATPSETRKQIATTELDEPQPWSSLPAYADVSGVGVYTTQFERPATWPSVGPVVLALGDVSDTFRVTVNGSALPAANLFSRQIDIGPWLEPGTNTIAIEVASTLRNTALTLYKEQAGRPRESYGLTGPVTLTPGPSN